MSPSPINLSRRSILGLAAGGALTVGLTACSKGSDPASSGSGSGQATASANSDAGSFPQSVKTIYGEVTVEKKPTNVVALFGAYGDICVALGVQPVALMEDPKELAPWFKDRFTGTLDPALSSQNGEVSPERIASYHPDLIIGASFSTSKEKYPQISKIAPEYCGRIEGTEPWTHIVEDLSLLLTGSAAKGDEVKKQVEDTMAPYKARIKGLQGKTYMWIAARDHIYYGNGSALDSLGLVAAPQQNDASKQDLSYENVDQLTADILAITADEANRKKLEADPRFAKLPASKNGTVVWASDDQAGAMQQSCPSAFTYLAEWITPELEKSQLNKA